MGTESFPGVKSGRGVTLTPHPLLVPLSLKNRAMPLLPLWAVRPVQSLSASTRVHFTLTFTFTLHTFLWHRLKQRGHYYHIFFPNLTATWQTNNESVAIRGFSYAIVWNCKFWSVYGKALRKHRPLQFTALATKWKQVKVIIPEMVTPSLGTQKWSYVEFSRFQLADHFKNTRLPVWYCCGSKILVACCIIFPWHWSIPW
jgi:hypothetical protein